MMVFRFFLLWILILTVKTWSQEALAAACCGGGFAVPALIVGDDKALMTTSWSQARAIADVGSDLLWRERTTTDVTETFRLEAAHIFHDRWQLGLGVPVMRRSRGDFSSSGLGDVTFVAGYEYLPDWDYHPFRPKGVGYIQVTAPTGRSVYDSEELELLDVRGRGFWAFGIGTVLTKTRGRWDAYVDGELHHSFDREDTQEQGDVKYSPGYGGRFGLGVGWSHKKMRWGGSMTSYYEDPIDVAGAVSSQGTLQRYAAAALSAQYLFSSEWAASLIYSDETVLGSPANATLSRSLVLLLQRRWLR